MRLRSIIYFEGRGEPSVYDLHVVTMPQVKTLDALLHGFDGPPIACVHFPPLGPASCPPTCVDAPVCLRRPGTLITDIPILVLCVPPPNPGDDLNCPALRYPEWQIVEAGGQPQPGAFAHHPRGSSYEEFLCVTRAIRGPATCSRASSAWLHGYTAAHTCPCASPGHTSLTPSASHVTLSDLSASRLLQPDEQQCRPWTGTSEETGEPHPPPRSCLQLARRCVEGGLLLACEQAWASGCGPPLTSEHSHSACPFP